MAEEGQILVKMYDAMLYIIPALERFPKKQKYVLGAKIEADILALMEDLVEAYYGAKAERRSRLLKINIRLEKIRYMLRLSHDLKLLGGQQYEQSTKHLIEIGKMVGGWIKAL